MTTEDAKDIAKTVLHSLSGTPALLFLLVILIVAMAVFYMDSSETREKIVNFVGVIEEHRHNELQICFETVRSCQDDITKFIVSPLTAQP